MALKRRVCSGQKLVRLSSRAFSRPERVALSKKRLPSPARHGVPRRRSLLQFGLFGAIPPKYNRASLWTQKMPLVDFYPRILGTTGAVLCIRVRALSRLCHEGYTTVEVNSLRSAKIAR